MNDDLRTGFLMGCAIGFDMDSDDIETVLKAHGLTLADDILPCQQALREHVGEQRWRNGIHLIQARTRPAEMN